MFTIKTLNKAIIYSLIIFNIYASILVFVYMFINSSKTKSQIDNIWVLPFLMVCFCIIDKEMYSFIKYRGNNPQLTDKFVCDRNVWLLSLDQTNGIIVSILVLKDIIVENMPNMMMFYVIPNMFMGIIFVTLIFIYVQKHRNFVLLPLVQQQHPPVEVQIDIENYQTNDIRNIPNITPQD